MGVVEGAFEQRSTRDIIIMAREINMDTCAKTFGQSQSKKKRKCVAHGTARIRAKNNRQKAWKTQTKSYSDVRQNYAHLCPRQLIEKLKDTMKMRLKSNYRN